MANIGPGKGYAKKDLNFFAQFTAKARQQAQILAIVVLVAAAFVIGFLVWMGIEALTNWGVKREVDKLTVELQDPKYANLDVEAKNLEQEIIARNQYFYSISEMRRVVDETPDAKTELAYRLGESIPNDTYIFAYEITGTQMTIQGHTFNYYEAVNMTNILQGYDVFAAPLNITTEHVNDAALNDQTERINGINTYYEFSIVGDLTVDSYISVGRIIDSDMGMTAVGGVVTNAYATGSTYEIPDIVTLEVNGVTYQLSSVLIDGVAVSEDEFNAIVANNAVSGRAAGNMNIELHYTLVDEASEGGEE